MSREMSNYDLKEEIRAYWSARAASFDQSPSHQIEDRYGMPEWQRLVRQAAGLTADETMQGWRVLDLACGTGEVSRVLCALGADVTGLDFSETMLNRARAKLKGQNWTPLLCDAEDLKGVPSDSVDFGITRHLAWTLTSPLDAYAEWFRVLKPNSRILINDHNFSNPFSFRHRLKKRIALWLDPDVPQDDAMISANTAIRHRLPYRDGLTKATLISQMQSRGFRVQQELDPASLYRRGMRAWPIATRLRQSSENRYALVFVKPDQ